MFIIPCVKNKRRSSAFLVILSLVYNGAVSLAQPVATFLPLGDLPAGPARTNRVIAYTG